MKLTENITRKEITCKCGCGLDTIDYMVVYLVQQARYHFNKPVIIHCGSRCKKHNTEVGGVSTSQHVICKAIDCHIDGVPHKELSEFFDSIMPGWGGVGLYDWGVHVDSRNKIARWVR